QPTHDLFAKDYPNDPPNTKDNKIQQGKTHARNRLGRSAQNNEGCHTPRQQGENKIHEPMTPFEERL
ncbi:MAG: hypothetical protein MUQ49_00545, partial [Loktanella sp.]|nr:hypothetical protein [Loktanella sp.]